MVYSEVARDRDSSGNGKGFVEYETAADLASAVEKLDNNEFKGATVRCISDVSSSSMSNSNIYLQATAPVRDPASA